MGIAVRPRYTSAQILGVVKESILTLPFPMILLAGIYRCFTIPTEAAILSLVCVTLIDVISFRKLTVRGMGRVLTKLAATSAVLVFYRSLCEHLQLLDGHSGGPDADERSDPEDNLHPDHVHFGLDFICVRPRLSDGSDLVDCCPRYHTAVDPERFRARADQLRHHLHHQLRIGFHAPSS
jgi:hypothetical protein